jgi:galactose mutarotase-like enzyme
MHHKIANDILEISVQQKGVELSSIKSLSTGNEFMWDANPEIWGSYAPVLFPAIGSFKNNECSIEGKTYKLPKHGIIRHNESIELIDNSGKSLHFRLAYSDDSLQLYPYKFIFNIKYKLEANKIIVEHFIENKDEKNIYFNLGGHPAFKCPLMDNEIYEDYYLEFEKNETAETTLLSENGLLSKETKAILNDNKTLALNKNLFDNDALILKNLKSNKVSVKSKNHSKVITVEFKDFPYLGLWAKPGANFVCIEPWIGTADYEDSNGNFLDKDRLIELKKGESFNASYSIEIKE